MDMIFGFEEPFNERISRFYFDQLINAIDYLHQNGHYHMDLKPQNILLDDEWNIKIIDFGGSTKDRINTE